MLLFLTLLSGAAWTLVYVEAIRVGHRDRTYAIPAAALALNFAWEALYAFHDLTTVASVQGFITLAWASADVVIVTQFFRFGRAELPGFVTPRMFVAWGVVLFATAFAVQWLFVDEFGWSAAGPYSAFLQNLLMSGLFIAMLVARGGARGQSMVIAVAKWIGTLAPTIQYGWIKESPFILGIGLLCSVLDLGYVWLLWRVRRQAGVAPSSPASGVPAADPSAGPSSRSRGSVRSAGWSPDLSA